MPGEPINRLAPGMLRVGLLLYLLLFVVLMANDARADTCRLSLSQSRVDYGGIYRAEGEGKSLSLGARTLHLNVVCDEPSTMALRFTGPQADAHGFRFGRQGRFTLNLTHARVDGQAVDWRGAQSPGELASGRLAPGQTLFAEVAGTAVTGRRLTAQVDIEASVPSHALDVSRETLFEGVGNIELVSLAVPPNR